MEPFPGYKRLIDIENNLGMYSNISISPVKRRDAGKLADAIRNKDVETASKIALKYQGELGKGDVQGGPKEVNPGDAIKKDIAHTALRFIWGIKEKFKGKSMNRSQKVFKLIEESDLVALVYREK